jgi:hypothetical protein
MDAIAHTRHTARDSQLIANLEAAVEMILCGAQGLAFTSRLLGSGAERERLIGAIARQENLRGNRFEIRPLSIHSSIMRK